MRSSSILQIRLGRPFDRVRGMAPTVQLHFRHPGLDPGSSQTKSLV